jgi:hypothetical protein
MNDDDAAELGKLKAMSSNPVNSQIDEAFKGGIKAEAKPENKNELSSPPPPLPGPGELSLGEIEEIDLDFGSENNDEIPPVTEAPMENDLDLSLEMGADLKLSENESDIDSNESSENQYGDISLDELEDEEEVPINDQPSNETEEIIENLGELSFDEMVTSDSLETSSDLKDSSLDDLGDSQESLGDEDFSGLNLSEEDNFDLISLEDSKVQNLNQKDVDVESPPELSFGSDEVQEDLSLDDNSEGVDFSEDAIKKLQEIDQILVVDASKIDIKNELKNNDNDLNESLVSEDINLENINFGAEEDLVKQDASANIPEVKEDKPKKKKKESQETKEVKEDNAIGKDLREISGAYSVEMERMQATIANLRGDREELLAKIQKLEEDKLIHARSSLSVRAELDEKKIELTIIRKKLNEEISELKDRLKLFEEKRLIMEEKNKILLQELDKSAQKNKIDVKKVQIRERELEQKLELLKSDAETQIRHRDLKILELKRKIDAMEFDMESISQQEKRSVESRFELEDKLEKAIKTLRSAINVLEDETDRTNALNALKKNIDM